MVLQSLVYHLDLAIRLGMDHSQEALDEAKLVTKSLNSSLSNCFPLSETNFCGIPNLQMMNFQMKLSIFSKVIVARGSASTHLVK